MPVDPAAPPPGADPKPERETSELEQGLNALGRTVGGVMTRLLGSRYTQVELDPDKPVISREADEAMERAGESLGRWLKATGEGLKTHPTDPIKAMEHAGRHKDEAPELREGEAPLAAGMRVLAGGLYRSTEAVLDVVAPRRPKAGAETSGGGEAEAGEDPIPPMPRDDPREA